MQMDDLDSLNFLLVEKLPEDSLQVGSLDYVQEDDLLANSLSEDSLQVDSPLADL